MMCDGILPTGDGNVTKVSTFGSDFKYVVTQTYGHVNRVGYL